MKPTYKKSWPGNLSMWSDLTLDPSFMQVFHWGNYAFLESRDQCLQSRLVSVVVSRPVWESR